MSTATIEQLQRIVTDENRPEAERKQAAEHILALQANATGEPAPAEDPALAKRRAQFTGAQRRLAAGLSTISKGTNLIDGKTEASAISDKLSVMQIVRLMADDDGSDGILNTVFGWNRGSKQTLADRIGDHPSFHECNPAYRLGMQSSERQRMYAKRQAEIMKVAYVEPKPELKLEAKTLVSMSSEKFAEFVIAFHRKVLGWDLKAFVYDNLSTPAAEFFAGFLELQRNADAEEESLFKNAMAAHMLATAPDSDGDDAEEFLGLLAWMGQRERLEDMRRLERIAKQKQRSASQSQAPAELTIRETAPKRSPLDDIDIKKVESYYDRQLAEIDAKLEALNAGQQEPSAAGASAL